LPASAQVAQLGDVHAPSQVAQFQMVVPQLQHLIAEQVSARGCLRHDTGFAASFSALH
jgi:hypothetical protein